MGCNDFANRDGVEIIDFVRVKKQAGERWEQVALRKAAEVQRAMRRHPTKVVVFLDATAS